MEKQDTGPQGMGLNTTDWNIKYKKNLSLYTVRASQEVYLNGIHDCDSAVSEGGINVAEAQ